MIKTKIVCTLGPATDDPRVLEDMILAGMNVARLNFSHSNHAEQKRRADMVKQLRKKLNVPVALMIDTKGPDVRVGKFVDNFAELFSGEEFVLTTDPAFAEKGTNKRAFITFEGLPSKVDVGERIMLDDGQIQLVVKSKTATNLTCKIEVGGILANNKSLNVPGVPLSIPFMRENDINDLRFAIENDFDIIAASFVRSKDDLRDLINLLREKDNLRDGDEQNTNDQNAGVKNKNKQNMGNQCGMGSGRGQHSRIMIISKIENREGIDNIDEILELSDGIMVARGDLGVEIDFEEIPSVQKYLISKALDAGKHCITATQMLESMIKNPRPTRAEITDVANSIYDGTSAIMLSGETAAGKHPVETIKTMVSIAAFTENDLDFKKRFSTVAYGKRYKKISDAVCMSSVALAHNIDATAIMAITLSGATANMVGHFRPACDILGFTSDEKTYNQMALFWGVAPFCVRLYDNAAELFSDCIGFAKQSGKIKKDDLIVTTSGFPLGIVGQTNNMRVIRVD